MKKYLLLRNNRQSGPYTFEQMSSINLLPLDLIWIEDESTSWNYPEEIEELKSLVGSDYEVEKDFSNEKEKVFISLPSNFVERSEQNDIRLRHEATDPVSSADMDQVEERKENHRTVPPKPIWNKTPVTSKSISAVAAVCIGAMLGAFIIKKWVDGYTSDNTPTAVAIPVIDRQPTPAEPNENFKNALVTEIVPVFKTPSKKPSRPADIKKQLKLETNDYKVGLFGGINGLQLTVFNTSSQYVDKVIVALDYLKPNGSVAQSENVLFTSIKPKGAQTIAIPGSNRGVKVHYKILKVYSHNYKADLKQV